MEAMQHRTINLPILSVIVATAVGKFPPEQFRCPRLAVPLGNIIASEIFVGNYKLPRIHEGPLFNTYQRLCPVSVRIGQNCQRHSKAKATTRQCQQVIKTHQQPPILSQI